MLRENAATGDHRTDTTPPPGPPSRPRILVTGTINRPDLVALFTAASRSAELHFVEYGGAGADLDPLIYRPYGGLSAWADHRGADALLDHLDPVRIVMLAINSREQVALRVAARRRGIEVVHLEHGYRLPLAMRAELGLTQIGSGRTIAPGLARHRFFARSLMTTPGRDRLRLAGYALATLRGLTPARVGAFGDVRRPDRYISFAPECFAFHRELDRVPDELAERTVYVGVPTFDSFRDGADAIDPRAAVLIDHHLHNGGIAGWTPDFHRAWAARVFETVCVRSGMTLAVKEHPADRTGSWAPFLGRGVTLLGSIDELSAALRSTRVVLGGSTTLQIPAAALSHTALITLELHPRPEVRTSTPFVAAGVAEPVADEDELRSALASAADLHARQAPHKPAFTERFLHRLDGGAQRRLADALA